MSVSVITRQLPTFGVGYCPRPLRYGLDGGFAFKSQAVMALETIEPTCRFCGTNFYKPAHLAGETFECPKCHRPVRTIKVVGRTDFQNASDMSSEARERAERSLAAGQCSGFGQRTAPVDADGIFSLGSRMESVGDFDSALDCYCDVTIRFPDTPEARKAVDRIEALDGRSWPSIWR